MKDAGKINCRTSKIVNLLIAAPTGQAVEMQRTISFPKVHLSCMKLLLSENYGGSERPGWKSMSKIEDGIFAK